MPRGRLNLTRWWQGKHPKDATWLKKAVPSEELQPKFFPGQRVKMIGLRSTKDSFDATSLNGKEGITKEYDALLGRWLVDVGSKEEGRSCIQPVWAKTWNMVPGLLFPCTPPD